jgi:alkaline phosphatase
VAYCLQEQGYNIGIISSVPVNHATPASFYAHQTYRGNYYSIASQIPATGFEYFASAGFLDYKDKNGDKEPIDQVIEAQGYTVCYGLEEYLSEGAGKEKVIFCQASNRQEDAENYVSDAKASEDIPLAKMVELGIVSLGDDEPFFIMCEGGTIDWAAHDNRTMSMVTDVIDFDAAIKVAYDFYLQHPNETLIVVTADHDTGGVAMGYGNQWMGDALHWRILDSAWNAAGGRNTLEWEENRKLNESTFIGWPTSHHTGDNVPVYAIGKGAEKFSGKMDNTDFKSKILAE